MNVLNAFALLVCVLLLLWLVWAAGQPKIGGTKAEKIEFYLSWRNTAIMVLIRNPEDEKAAKVKDICEQQLRKLGVF